VRVRALAKINLTLEIVGVRADGYHELRTVFQSIALHDTLTIRARRGPWQLTCDVPDVPTDESNLVTLAARAAWRAAGRRGAPRDIGVHLTKRIPLAAGLGGGSSDAAAALKALGRLWRVDPARLRTLAAAIGADVPYFFEGGTVLGLDRGDTLFPLIDSPPAWVVLVLPEFGVGTRDAYAWFDADSRSSFDRLRMSGPGRSPASSSSKGERLNDLEGAVARRHPEISRIAATLRGLGASRAAMTGSGSAVFGLFADRPAAVTASARVRAALHTPALVTRTVSRAAYGRLAAN
jgi:4-diphosphocytidyl-2-C-methyl-D-erythritol kinase